MNRQQFLDVFSEHIPENYNKSRFVPSEGSFDTNLVLVGEAPGADEVKKQRPFIGSAGKQLDKALEELGIDRNKLYITNTVKIRPPNNRDPTEEEKSTWKPLLKAEIEKVDPSIVVCLGKQPSMTLTGRDGEMDSFRRKDIGMNFGNAVFKLNCVYHPALTLYEPNKWSKFVGDLEYAFQNVSNIEDDQNYLGDY